MFVSAQADVLAVREKVGQDGTRWADVYLLQEGRAEPIRAYLNASEVPVPGQGERLHLTADVYPSRSGGLAVKILAHAPALAAAASA